MDEIILESGWIDYNALSVGEIIHGPPLPTPIKTGPTAETRV